ncbi:MAG: hypothetical protein IIY43_07485 [Oscillospiraceae bacterium]|nr:hypothetical protein [Oscillospiraceae bacterium]
MSERIIPDIPKAKAHWERRCDPVPYLLVPMSDGTVMRYNADIQHPGYVKAIQNIRNMEGYTHGKG